MRAIAARFWGSEVAADFSTYEGKALAAKKIQDRSYAKECLILCDWLWPIMEMEFSEDHVGDPTLESQIVSAVTGRELDEEGLNRIGERVFNLQRAIHIREGHKGTRVRHHPGAGLHGAAGVRNPGPAVDPAGEGRRGGLPEGEGG